MKVLLISIIAIASFMTMNAEEYFGSIKGKIINKISKQPEALVTVKLLNTKFGAISAKDGSYIIKNVPEGVYNIEYSMIGFSKVIENSVRVIRNKATTIKEIEMEENTIQTNEAVVEADANRSTEAKALSYSYSKSEITKCPGSGGEVLRAIEVLPGVSSGGGEYAGFMVRGSAPDENIILVDGYPFSSITHFSEGNSEDLASGGRFSIFTPGVIENAEFQGGGFSSKYGGKNASFLDLKIRDGNTDDITMNGTYDLLGWEVNYDGPSFINESTSIIASAKHHNYGNVMKLIGEEQHGISKLSDVLFKTTTNLANHKISFLAIYADEGMDKTKENVYKYDKLEDLYKNAIAHGAEYKNLYGLSWRWLTTENTFLNTKVYYENIRADWNSGRVYTDPINGVFPTIGQALVEENRYITKQYQDKIGAKMDFTYILSKGNSISLGLEANSQNFEQSFTAARTDTIYEYSSTDRRPNDTQKYLVLTPEQMNYKFNKRIADYSAWTELNWQVANNLSLTPGVRLEQSEINNTPYFSPRLAMKYLINDRSSLNFATGIYYQTPNMEYIFTNDKIEQERALHFILGYNNYLTDDISLSAECYYKSLDNLVVKSDRSDYSAQNIGYGYATGIDLSLVKRMTDNFFGQVSYSYSISKRNDDDGKGNYNSNFNQPHVFNILAGWQLSNEWSVSARWKYATGLPTDEYIIHADVLNNPNKTRYSRETISKNTTRYNDNHSLNLRVDYRKQIFNRFAVIAFIDVLNVYGYENQNETKFLPATGKVTNQGYSVLPTFGFKFEF